ncbi:hypothetical protein HDU79_002183 [Rhizoclosmatium sp. JEL0117]|nr:hypothetical protein HDU79_002183 [Rhizoclosmatium sp. JEL0117]
MQQEPLFMDEHGRVFKLVHPSAQHSEMGGTVAPSDGGDSTAYYQHLQHILPSNYGANQYRDDDVKFRRLYVNDSQIPQPIRLNPEYHSETPYGDPANPDHAANIGSAENLDAEEPVNWVVVENEQNGMLLVMDATSAAATGQRHVVYNSGGADPMRYLNVVETEPNAFQYIPSSSPSNATTHLNNPRTSFSSSSSSHQNPQHQHHPQALLKIPSNSHPTASLIKKQPASIMQRNHLSHLMSPHSPTSNTTQQHPTSPNGSPIPTTPTAFTKLFRRIRATCVYTLLICAAWYIKDPQGFLRQAKRAQKLLLAYTVILFGGMDRVKGVSAADLSLGSVVRVVFGGVVSFVEGVVVEGGKVLGYDVVRKGVGKSVV